MIRYKNSALKGINAEVVDRREYDAGLADWIDLHQPDPTAIEPYVRSFKTHLEHAVAELRRIADLVEQGKA